MILGPGTQIRVRRLPMRGATAPHAPGGGRRAYPGRTSALRLGRRESRAGQHRATAGRRNPAIRWRMARNSSRGTAPSAIWKTR